MTTIETIIQPKNNHTIHTENQRGIENHKKTAILLEAAAKHHKEAAQHHSNGDHDKAALSTLLAHGHVLLANETQKQDIKHHTLQS